jgi:hypothetical protein
LALGRLISFLFRHKLTNSASSFEKVLSGTLGACAHAVYGQECSVYAVQCPCSAHAVCMHAAHQHALQRALAHGEGTHGLGVPAAASEARPLLGVP